MTVVGLNSVRHRLCVGTVVEKTKSWSCMSLRTATAWFVAGEALTGEGISIWVQMHSAKTPIISFTSHLSFLMLQ